MTSTAADAARRVDVLLHHPMAHGCLPCDAMGYGAELWRWTIKTYVEVAMDGYRGEQKHQQQSVEPGIQARGRKGYHMTASKQYVHLMMLMRLFCALCVDAYCRC